MATHEPFLDAYSKGDRGKRRYFILRNVISPISDFDSSEYSEERKKEITFKMYKTFHPNIPIIEYGVVFDQYVSILNDKTVSILDNENYEEFARFLSTALLEKSEKKKERIMNLKFFIENSFSQSDIDLMIRVDEIKTLGIKSHKDEPEQTRPEKLPELKKPEVVPEVKPQKLEPETEKKKPDIQEEEIDIKEFIKHQKKQKTKIKTILTFLRNNWKLSKESLYEKIKGSDVLRFKLTFITNSQSKFVTDPKKTGFEFIDNNRRLESNIQYLYSIINYIYNLEEENSELRLELLKEKFQDNRFRMLQLK